MKIKINNELREIADGLSIADLLIDIPNVGTATSLNGRFICRDNRATTLLQDGDEVIIISAAYGG